MKKSILYILLSLPLFSTAQSLSIEELWSKVDKSRVSIEQNTKLDIQLEDINIENTSKLPIFYADANLQRNLITPTTPVPTIAFNPNAAEGEITPLKFATKWSSRAGINLEWNFLDPNRKNNILEKKLNLKKAELDQKDALVNWKKDATLAYASVILSTYQYQMAQEDSTLYASILQIAKERYEAGRNSSSEYIQAQQEMQQKQINIYEAWSVLQESSLELSKYIDEEIQTVSSSIEEVLAHIDYNRLDNYTIEKLTVNQELSSLNIRQLKQQRLPSLSFNGYYGSQFFNNELNIWNNEQWFGNSYVNITAKLPISDFIWKNSDIKKATLENKLSTLQLQNQQIEDNIAAKKKLAKVQAATQKLARLKEIEKLALQNKTEQLEVFKAGRLLLSDYNTILINHNKAKQNVWQATYDFIGIILE